MHDGFFAALMTGEGSILRRVTLTDYPAGPKQGVESWHLYKKMSNRQAVD